MSMRFLLLLAFIASGQSAAADPKQSSESSKLRARGDQTINVDANTPAITFADISDRASILITGGLVRDLALSGSATATIRGGEVSRVLVAGNAKLHIIDGKVGQHGGLLNAKQQARVEIDGGVIPASVLASDTASIRIKGGVTRSSRARAWNDAVIHFVGNDLRFAVTVYATPVVIGTFADGRPARIELDDTGTGRYVLNNPEYTQTFSTEALTSMVAAAQIPPFVPRTIASTPRVPTGSSPLVLCGVSALAIALMTIALRGFAQRRRILWLLGWMTAVGLFAWLVIRPIHQSTLPHFARHRIIEPSRFAVLCASAIFVAVLILCIRLRRVKALATILSAAIFVTGLTLWAQSYRVTDMLEYRALENHPSHAVKRTLCVTSSIGGVRFARAVEVMPVREPLAPDLLLASVPLRPARNPAPPATQSSRRYPFDKKSVDRPQPFTRLGVAVNYDRAPSGFAPDSQQYFSLVLPWWLVCIPFGIAPIVAARRLTRRFVRRSHGQCLACGYDLRATPDRCPECGAPGG